MSVIMMKLTARLHSGSSRSDVKVAIVRFKASNHV
jgi:hypothetical protein